mmetsp:Transcript_28859/g.93890  ORF Transcript_28859/g.93890 Transcript_28859/m.93890 type:complete len:293 (-) Transcript_28859:327-1205(-)
MSYSIGPCVENSTRTRTRGHRAPGAAYTSGSPDCCRCDCTSVAKSAGSYASGASSSTSTSSVARPSGYDPNTMHRRRSAPSDTASRPPLAPAPAPAPAPSLTIGGVSSWSSSSRYERSRRSSPASAWLSNSAVRTRPRRTRKRERASSPSPAAAAVALAPASLASVVATMSARSCATTRTCAPNAVPTARYAVTASASSSHTSTSCTLGCALSSRCSVCDLNCTEFRPSTGLKKNASGVTCAVLHASRTPDAAPSARPVTTTVAVSARPQWVRNACSAGPDGGVSGPVTLAG